MRPLARDKESFTEGPLFFKITFFALPIMLTGFLQIAYNMADNITVGQFSSDPNALAAVGSTGSLNSLVVNILMGIAAGTGVVVAQYYGARDKESISCAVHTAMLFSVISGIAFGILGLLISRPALVLLGTKSEVLESAILYFRIICIGIPANTVYNFGAGVLRGRGNSRVPLIILGSSGMVNVILNLVFVIGLGMSVEGVAIATIAAQYISAVAVVVYLATRRGEPIQLRLSCLRVRRRYLYHILRQGVPAGIQGSTFAIANVLMTGAINTFPTAVMTGNSIASNIDSITLTAISCFGQASMTFTGQNVGAKKPDRVRKTVIYCMIQSLIVGITVASLELIFADQIISLYINSGAENRAEVTDAALTIIRVMLSTYVIYGLMDSLSGAIKGLGKSVTAMVISLVCICGLRMVWILGIFPTIGSLTGLFLSYPISWTVALICVLIAFLICYRSFRSECAAEPIGTADKK